MNYLKNFVILFFFLLIFILLDFFGIIWHNNIFAHFYKIKGLDVSNHQREIEWKEVAKNHDFSFVYIKATEGDDYYDDFFIQNWKGAKSVGLKVGAYHFFSTRSSGRKQAEYFISKVPKELTAMPPVIDVEIDTNKDPKLIRGEIASMEDILFQYYGKKPILYVTYETYNAYVKGYFAENNIWIRDVIKPPFMFERKWLLWQYSNRGRVRGIKTYVDINVFRGEKSRLMEL